MREVGIIVWALFIVAGVAANIVSTARKQRTSQPVQPRTLTQPSAPSAQNVAPARIRRPQPAVVPVAAPTLVAHEPALRKPRPFFDGAPSIVRAVIAAEVFGKPRALRDE